MALLSLQDQIDFFLRRELVTDKTKGTPAAEIQATSVIETVALNFYLFPRTALYFFHLARNSLLALLGTMFDTIEATRGAIEDLGNPSYAIRDTSALKQASLALGQVNEQGRLNPNTGSFQNFLASVDVFLHQQLAKNVRKPNVSSLVRPSVEAAIDLPGEFATLQGLHAEMLDRLYSLAVGIRNFESSLTHSVIGITTVSRVQNDIDSIVQELTDDPSGADSRNHTIRLIAARRALALIGASPDVEADKVSTSKGLPSGYTIRGRTVLATPTVVQLYVPSGSVGPVPVVAADLVDQSDLFLTPSGGLHIISTSDDTFTLEASIPAFDGAVVVRSSLVDLWRKVQASLDSFLGDWAKSGFHSNLDKLDRMIAPLYGSPTRARRNDALDVLTSLETMVLDLQTRLSTYPLPVGSGREEQVMAHEILQLLTDRKFDRAGDFLLRCRIKEVFDLDWQTASFSGELLAATSDFAQSDIHWPDRSKDEGYEPHGTEELGP